MFALYAIDILGTVGDTGKLKPWKRSEDVSVHCLRLDKRRALPTTSVLLLGIFVVFS